MANYAKAMEEQGIPFDDLSGEEAMKRYVIAFPICTFCFSDLISWPQLTLRPTDRVLYQSDAGIVDPRKVNSHFAILCYFMLKLLYKKANAAHVSLARARGAKIMENTKVTAIVPETNKSNGRRIFKVVTKDKGTFTCDKVVMAAASWTNPLLNGN